MISTEAFTHGVVKFVSSEVLPKMPNSLNKFLGYMAVGAVQKNGDVVFRPYLDMMGTVGIVRDGMVDTDMMKTALETAFKQQPSVTVAGFTFTEGDIPTFLRYVE